MDPLELESPSPAAAPAPERPAPAAQSAQLETAGNLLVAGYTVFAFVSFSTNFPPLVDLWADLLFALACVLELCAKARLFGPSYFLSSRWHRLDLLSVLLASCLAILSLAGAIPRSAAVLLRLVRLVRIACVSVPRLVSQCGARTPD
jgi:hypothetical protein